MTAGRADRQQIEEAATDDYLEIPDVLGGEEGDFLIQVESATAKRAGILKGDYVVVRPTDVTSASAIVAAVAGEGEERRAVVLEIGREPSPNVEVLGLVVGVVRKVEQ